MPWLTPLVPFLRQCRRTQGESLIVWLFAMVHPSAWGIREVPTKSRLEAPIVQLSGVVPNEDHAPSTTILRLVT